MWHLVEPGSFDESGEIAIGTDHFYAWCVNQVYDVQYKRGKD